MTFPWETPVPAVVEPEQLPASVETVVASLQRDFAYAVQMTAVLVHSNNEALRMLVNTPRGQIIPRGKCKFIDGTTVEFQDVGMPQIGVEAMTVQELVARMWQTAIDLGLELQK